VGLRIKTEGRAGGRKKGIRSTNNHLGEYRVTPWEGELYQTDKKGKKDQNKRKVSL